MSHCLTIRGQFAQDRKDVIKAVRLLEAGNLKLRKCIDQEFTMENHEAAMKSAAQSSGWEKMAVFRVS
jgi:threonine dehydrogenase-like Zn-dependent dehydrogenase